MPLVKTSRANLWIADGRRDNGNATAILIHGAGASHLSFSRELRQLKCVNPIAVDLSGHGKSLGKGHDSINDHALDILALLDALDTTAAVIIGHSMGGAIAQRLALDHADRVMALVLIATGDRLAVNPALISGIVSDRVGTIGRLNRWMWSRESAETLREQSAEIMLQTDAAVLQRDFIACDRFDVSERLAEITANTLILAGEHDKMTPLSLSQDLAKHIPLADLIVMPGGSHLFMLEQADETARSVENWLCKRL